MGAVDGRVRFGPFELEVRTGELRKHGIRLKLQDQPLRILLMLLEHPGALVTREEICRNLWLDGTFVDFDRSINVAVTRLRQVLGDSAENPKFVETVARRGYRFVASVEGVPRTPVNPNSISNEVARAKRTSSQLLWAGLLGLLLVAIAGALWLIRRQSADLSAEMKIIPLTSYPGWEKEPSFSPDGDRVAFSWNGEQQDRFSIYVKAIGPGPPLRLTTHPANDRCAAWAPDGRSIAFLREIPDREYKMAVMLIPSMGGPERKLREIFCHFGTAYLNWSPDGKWLVLAGRTSLAERHAMFLLSPDTGEERRFTTNPQPMTGDMCPALSPNGRALVFIRWTGPGAGDLYMMPLSENLSSIAEPTRLTSDLGSLLTPIWTSDGKEILFSYEGGEKGPSIARLPVSTAPGRPTKPKRIAAFGEGSSNPAISNLRHRLVYVSLSSDENVWRMELPKAPGNVHGGKPGSRTSILRSTEELSRVELIASTRLDWAAAYSPDGKKIAFSSTRSGRDEIWIVDSDGKNPFQLTDLVGEAMGTAHWSPDGRYIAFDARVAGSGGDIFAMDIEERKPRQLTHDPGDELEPTWSRDGRWIYFPSNRTGHWQVWKIPSHGGDAVQVTQNGGFYSLEALDGKYLYYGKSLDPPGGIWRIPIEGGKETEVIPSISMWCNFTVSAEGIYFISPTKPPSIEFLSFRDGGIKTLLRHDGLGVGLDISPDARYLLYTQNKFGGSDLMLVENFR